MSKAILIGSRALNYWYPAITLLPTTDWDIVSLSEVVGEGIEWHALDILNNKDLYKYVSSSNTIEHEGMILYILSLKGLSLVKRSHLHRDLKFDRHIAHYWKYLEKESCNWEESDLEFLSTRTTMTKKAYPQCQSNLTKEVGSFFNDAVKRKYNHDYLHSLFAYEEKPMYTKLQLNPKLAKCEEDLWNKLSYEQKVQCVAEETQVIATERFLVPKDWDYPAKAAYMKALQKVCTTLTSGWFRDFALDNYPSVVQMFSRNKFNEVQQRLVN